MRLSCIMVMDRSGELTVVAAQRCVAFFPDLARLHDYSVGAPTVAAQHVLGPLDADTVTEHLTEKRQLVPAELRTELRGLRDRAVVLYKIDYSIPDPPTLGHVAFLASDTR